MAGDRGIGESSEAVSELPGASAGAASRTVFLSYASPDAETVNQVCRFLESHGVSCWMAPRNVKPGGAYADAIVRAINEASALVLVLSGAAMASEHVSREVERAASKHKPVVAFRVDGASLSAELEYFLSRSQWIDVPTLGMSAALVKLAEAVGQGWAAAQANPGLDGGGASGRASIRQTVGTATVAKRVVVAAIVVVFGVGGVLAVRFWPSKQGDAPGVAAISDKSIAVLPFVDMSEKKDQEYFSDGLSEELIDMLTKVKSLRVPARTSSFYFKGKQATVADIAKALGVAHVLEGSVRKSGNTLRITAQLIRADNGYHVWSETYDRQLDDVFKVQDEIAGAVVKVLKVSLLTEEAPRATPTTNTEAYTLYLQARGIALRAGQGDYKTAIGLLRRALELDPQFAAAWAELANDVVDEFNWNKLRPAADARAEADQAAAEAVKFDPDLPAGHLAKAKISLWIDWDWDAAEAEFRRTLALDPRNADALRMNSYLAQALFQVDRQLLLARSAVDADPLNSWNYFAVGIAHLLNGKPTDAERSFRKALELNPTGAGMRGDLGLALVAQGNPAAGLAEIMREGDGFFRQAFRPYALEALGRKGEADAVIAATEKQYAAQAPGLLGRWYECHGDVDRASVWLDRAYRQRDTVLLWTDPCRRKLSSDPRYKAFLREMNLSK